MIPSNLGDGKTLSKTYVPIEMSNFNLVEYSKGTPHCLKHGAMNKVSVHEDGGGYWRCVSAISKQNDNICRAGCCEKRLNLYKTDREPE